MIFKDKDHYVRFSEAQQRIDLNDQLAQADCFLLTFRESVWRKVKKHIKPNVFDFDDFGFFPKDETEQALFNSAYDLYYGADSITVCDLCDRDYINDEAFRAIIGAVMYLRFGTEEDRAVVREEEQRSRMNSDRSLI